MAAKFVAVLVACSSGREARAVVDSLLKKRLIACANILGGVESKFWWKGKIDSSKESLVILKTAARHFGAVEKEVKRLHSYEVPEIIALPIAAGNKAYLGWMEKEV